MTHHATLQFNWSRKINIVSNIDDDSDMRSSCCRDIIDDYVSSCHTVRTVIFFL